MIEDEELTGKIIKTFYKVYNILGYGFIESIYHNAMIIELTGLGLTVETEKLIAVFYEGRGSGHSLRIWLSRAGLLLSSRQRTG